jgi:hypothetical protein
VLDRLWAVNPEGHRGLQSWGPIAIVFMGVVSATCTATAIGLWKARRWGLVLAIAVLSVNLLSDVATALIRNRAITLIGVPIAGAAIIYLVRTLRVSSTAR